MYTNKRRVRRDVKESQETREERIKRIKEDTARLIVIMPYMITNLVACWFEDSINNIELIKNIRRKKYVRVTARSSKK